MNKQYDEIHKLAKQILPKGQFREYVIRQHELADTVNRVETILMDGFKNEARTVLSGKLGRDQADELLEKKYDVETALVIETSVTEAVMQMADIEGELTDLRRQVATMQEMASHASNSRGPSLASTPIPSVI